MPPTYADVKFEDTLWRKVARRLAIFAAPRRVSLQSRSGIVSFTFDDVPQSACHQGRDILERYNFRGTYYVSGGLTDSNGSQARKHSRADLQRLLTAGHELGCHGFAHKNYQTLTSQEIRADIDRNRAFFQDLGGSLAVNFAYPFGCVNPAVKRLIGDTFISARGIRARLNLEYADLALLNAVGLSDCLWTEESLAQLIGRAAQKKAWLIFVTHAVAPDPDRFGCTPSLLEFAVREAKTCGCRVMTVKDVLDKKQLDSDIFRISQKTVSCK
jgi:peptidoglycan/xylan/chitin deacetylase (PgdA/CDA1 family)